VSKFPSGRIAGGCVAGQPALAMLMMVPKVDGQEDPRDATRGRQS
jgi:hypothetical protein